MDFNEISTRRSIEKIVTRYHGNDWQIRDVNNLSDLAWHPCAILSGNSISVFVKFSDAQDAMSQFTVENESLMFLKRAAGVRVPNMIGIEPIEEGVLFITQAVNEVPRYAQQWREIGRTLARIHKLKSDSFGFHFNNYFGPLAQDNRHMNNWAEFYGERRLLPRLKTTVDAGYLPYSLSQHVENIIKRLPELGGPTIAPTLLHGDAQKNNFISTAHGVYVIDPAIYYGNPEMDLAYIDYFEPVPDDVFDGYREEGTISPGFHQRRSLWRLYGYLAAVEVEGQKHIPKLENAIKEYQ